jgi:hypothetical protein
MVDVNKRRGSDSNDSSDSSSSSSSSSSSRSKPSSSGSSGSGSEGAEPFEMGDDAIPDAEEASISDTSKRWAGDHSDLNYDNGASGGLDGYISAQVDECEEFYQNFYNRASGHLQDINQFTLYFHAMTLAMARNRLGIRRILMDEFGKGQKEAVQLTGKICQEAGEQEYMDKLLRDMTHRLDEDE